MVDIKIIKTGAGVLGGVAIIVVIVMAILMGFNASVRNLTSAETNVTLGTTNASASVGTTGLYPYLQTAVCSNATGVLTSFNDTLYSVVEGTDDGGAIGLIEGEGGAGSAFAGGPVDCDITYLADTDASDTVDDFILALRVFATFAGVVAIGLMGYALWVMFAGRKSKTL